MPLPFLERRPDSCTMASQIAITAEEPHTVTGIPSDAAERLAHVYWIGGSPCSGKSSIVSWLGERASLRVYRCDDPMWAHMARATPTAQPHMHSALRGDPDRRLARMYRGSGTMLRLARLLVRVGRWLEAQAGVEDDMPMTLELSGRQQA